MQYILGRKNNKNHIDLINKKLNLKENINIVFYGELYNKNELKQDLLRQGYNLKSDNEIDIILCGYEVYSVNFFEKMNGGFVLIINDNQNDELLIVRDCVGIKPVYYYSDLEKLIFSTSLKKMKEYYEKEINFELNNEALESYLSFQYSVLNESLYKNIYKLLPGHYLIYKNNNVKIEQYYKITFETNYNKSIEEYAKEIHENTKRIVSDYEINADNITTFLSSGVDSSYVTSLAKKAKDTYTIGFENLVQNESNYAKALSDKLKKKNNLINVTGDMYFEAIKEISKFIDEPLADPSSVGLFLLCKEASKKYTTALIGEGVDEFFGGYNVYKEPLEFSIYNKIPFIFRKVVGIFCSLLPEIRGINFLVRRGKKVEDWYIGNANIFSYKERRTILKNKTNLLKPKDFTKKYYDLVKEQDDITKMQYIDINLWLVGDELFNAEMMGKYNNINLKAPFLNRDLIDIATKVPVEQRVSIKNTKLVLRLAAKNTLDKNWYDKKKLGFPIPLRNWLKEEKYYNMVKECFESNVANKIFNNKKIINLLDEHRKGKKDNSRKIWVIYVFVLWYQYNLGEEV